MDDPYQTTIIPGPFAGPEFFDEDKPIEGVMGPCFLIDPQTGETTVLSAPPIPERKRAPGS